MLFVFASLGAAPIAATEPPPPPPIAMCGTGPYYFFFDSNSAAVTIEAKVTLDTMFEYLDGCQQLTITIAGNIDGTEDGRLSLARARSFHSLLIENGIPANTIILVDSGRSKPMVPGNGPEVQNRYVEISMVESR